MPRVDAATIEPINVSQTCWLYAERGQLVVVSGGVITEIPWSKIEAALAARPKR